ncbi:hypothetical protein [Nonomuraea rubra]|uniref:hypothetical protein n=1 Tax=Nonomuraea rubra TaxID=46180 RepID=UPI0031EEC6CA
MVNASRSAVALLRWRRPGAGGHGRDAVRAGARSGFPPRAAAAYGGGLTAEQSAGRRDRVTATAASIVLADRAGSSARRPGAIRPRSARPKQRAVTPVAAASACSP